MLLLRKQQFSLLSQTRVLTTKSLDGQPTDLFFMIAAPEGANDTHLAALAELSQYLMKDGFADKLRQVTSADQVIELFDQASEKSSRTSSSSCK